MSKTKLILTIAGALCAGGLVLSAVSFSLMGFDVEKISAAPKLEEKSYTTQMADLSEIVVRSEDIRVELTPTEGTEIKVHYFENDNYACEISKQQGQLTVQAKNRYRWFDTFRYGLFKDINLVDHRILVEVPAEYSGSVRIDNQNASVRVEDVILKKLECNTSNSTITISNADAGELSAITSNGGVRLNDVSVSGPLNAKNSNGAIRINSVEANDSVVSTSNGSVSLEDVTLSSLKATNSNGKIALTRVISSQTLSAATSNGAIQIEQLAGPNLTLRTSNGKVSGNIVGKESDYGIIAETSNGSNNLDNQVSAGEKFLRINNSNGGIHIIFTEQ